MTPETRSPLSGLTENEAREFHNIFMMSFLIFTAIAIVAHILVWMWRPWIPGPDGYSSLVDSVRIALDQITPFIG